MSKAYILKISPQGQLTLPRDLRERLGVRPGSRIAVTAANDGSLRVSAKAPVTKHFGTMPNLWTRPGQDAAEYSRGLRNAMQPKLDRTA